MNASRYKDMVVVITGGSSGIGRGCAIEFVKAGSRVVICSNDAEQGATTAAMLQRLAQEQAAGEPEFIYCDVTKAPEMENVIETAVSRYGRLDCLINNAGRHPPHKSIDEFSAGDFRDLIELNLVGIFTACKLALPHLRKSKGNIINVASLVATIGQRLAVTYVATKGAVVAFTKALAIDEAPNGVRVNSVSPGNIYTPLWQAELDAAPDPRQFLLDGEAAQLLGRLGTSEEVGRLCLFIAADATFTTGVDHFITAGAELGYGRKSEKGETPQVEQKC
ncbi:MAG TPA: SDR family NAD(P)-dependent oxidoreductase [Blastocatellia bacterium]|nr:SDR family NAD(P)-dependent oxidoreductase [Blastocatellia bacterium]